MEQDKWVSVKDKLPEYKEVFPRQAQRVLVLMDYKKWGRDEQRIEIACVHYASEPKKYGGPNSLTGSGYLTGIYYSLPAIINPECVTHWQPLPLPPNTPTPIQEESEDEVKLWMDAYAMLDHFGEQETMKHFTIKRKV